MVQLMLGLADPICLHIARCMCSFRKRGINGLHADTHVLMCTEALAVPLHSSEQGFYYKRRGKCVMLVILTVMCVWKPHPALSGRCDKQRTMLQKILAAVKRKRKIKGGGGVDVVAHYSRGHVWLRSSSAVELAGSYCYYSPGWKKKKKTGWACFQA